MFTVFVLYEKLSIMFHVFSLPGLLPEALIGGDEIAPDVRQPLQ